MRRPIRRTAFRRFYERVRDKGFILYPGKLTQVETFRVGCIGAIGPDEMRQAVNAVRDTLARDGHPADGAGAAARAAPDGRIDRPGASVRRAGVGTGCRVPQRFQRQELGRVRRDRAVPQQAVEHDQARVGGDHVGPVGSRDQPRRGAEVDPPVLDDLAVLVGTGTKSAGSHEVVHEDRLALQAVRLARGRRARRLPAPPAGQRGVDAGLLPALP